MVIVTGTYLLIIHFCKFNFQQLPSLLVSLLFFTFIFGLLLPSNGIVYGGGGKKVEIFYYVYYICHFFSGTPAKTCCLYSPTGS